MMTLLVLTSTVACGGDGRRQQSSTLDAVTAEGALSLRIGATDVAWTKISENANQSKWIKTAASVELTCDPDRLEVTQGAEAFGHALSAAQICASIASHPRLLHDEDRAACEDLRYWDVEVRVTGSDHGMPVHLDLSSCAYDGGTSGPADAAQRWLTPLGLHPAGPDP